MGVFWYDFHVPYTRIFVQTLETTDYFNELTDYFNGDDSDIFHLYEKPSHCWEDNNVYVPEWQGECLYPFTELFRKIYMHVLTLRVTSWKWSRSSTFSKRTCLNQGLADRMTNNYPFSSMPYGSSLLRWVTLGQRSWMWTLNKKRKLIGWIRNQPLCALLAGQYTFMFWRGFFVDLGQINIFILHRKLVWMPHAHLQVLFDSRVSEGVCRWGP